MISRLYINDPFRHNGRTFYFEKGLTAIIGPNESGKSLILEMIRYALFGSKALRGDAADYKGLHVELDFFPRGEAYTVIRKGNRATLLKDGKEEVTGTKPVNARIIEILGYDLAVFDVANICNQGKIEALGEMRPADRKKMVDQTIGLDVLDDLAQQVGEKANAEKKAAEAIEGVLVEPTAPVAPLAYRPSAEIAEEAGALRKAVEELHSLSGWLSQPGLARPERPVCSVRESAEELARHQRDRDEAARRVERIRARLDALKPAPKWTSEQLDDLSERLEKFRRWQEREAFLAQNPQPQWTVEQLDEMSKDLDAIENNEARLRLLTRIESLKAKGYNECPKCKHQWPHEHEEIERLLAELPDELPVANRPVWLTRPEIALERERIARWESLGNRWKRLMDAEKVDHPGINEREIEIAREALRDAEERAKLEAELASIEIPEDRSADLEARQRYEWELEQYDARLADYEAYMKERAEKEKRLEELKGTPEKLQAVEEALIAARAYESQLEAYVEAKYRYEEQKTKADEHWERAEQYAKARSAIKTLKTRVKRYLVPSLNRVASHLLSQMTNGARNQIVIDEEFNITVDGTAIHKLSGSGKAVANLAIRIGLGQVLTNKVFSVFAGDEIDASMDADRAGFTAQCLQNLTGSIRQVLLVSHKTPEADHYIDLAA